MSCVYSIRVYDMWIDLRTWTSMNGYTIYQFVRNLVVIKCIFQNRSKHFKSKSAEIYIRISQFFCILKVLIFLFYVRNCIYYLRETERRILRIDTWSRNTKFSSNMKVREYFAFFSIPLLKLNQSLISLYLHFRLRRQMLAVALTTV